MRTSSALSLLVLALLFPLIAQEPSPPKPILERWFVRETPAGRIGDLHLTTRETVRAGQRVRHSRQVDRFSYIRSGDPYTEENVLETWEDFTGKLVEFWYQIPLGKKQNLIVRGRPQGQTVILEVLDEATQAVQFTVNKPWNPAALGLYALETRLVGQNLELGSTFSMPTFEIALNEVVTNTLTVVARHPQPDGSTWVEMRLTYPRETYFDPSTLFVDAKTGLVVKTTEESISFDRVDQYEVTAEVGQRKFSPSVRDKDAPITISKPITPFRRGGPRELKVRVRHDTDEDIATIFPLDVRQRLVRTDPHSAELHLFAPRRIEEYPKEPPPAPEYLASNFYVRTDAPEVEALARKILGTEEEPRRQLHLISTWIRANVKGSYEVAFATANEVARTLEGDCTEMGVLAAALARRAGLPSRIAFGLVYDPEEPGFGGHLWTEVYLDDHWEAWDVTGVLKTVGAAYLKVGHFSLDGVVNPDELTNVRRAFAGRLHVELLEVNGSRINRK